LDKFDFLILDNEFLKIISQIKAVLRWTDLSDHLTAVDLDSRNTQDMVALKKTILINSPTKIRTARNNGYASLLLFNYF